jgi:hypothetical protein
MCIQPLDGSSLCSIILGRRLFVLHLVVHEDIPVWWAMMVRSSQMNSRRHSLLYISWDKHTHARTHTHIHTHTHTQHLKTEWHSAACISSYRPQHHSQVPGGVAYDMFIIKVKYCEWCNTTVLHCISVNNSQRMWIYSIEIVALTMKNHVPGYPVHHTWHPLTSTCVDTKEVVLLDRRHEMNSYGTWWIMLLSNWTVMKANRKQHTLS